MKLIWAYVGWLLFGAEVNFVVAYLRCVEVKFLMAYVLYRGEVFRDLCPTGGAYRTRRI